MVVFRWGKDSRVPSVELVAILGEALVVVVAPPAGVAATGDAHESAAGFVVSDLSQCWDSGSRSGRAARWREAEVPRAFHTPVGHNSVDRKHQKLECGAEVVEVVVAAGGKTLKSVSSHCDLPDSAGSDPEQARIRRVRSHRDLLRTEPTIFGVAVKVGAANGVHNRVWYSKFPEIYHARAGRNPHLHRVP
jgi:hypothetical protein